MCSGTITSLGLPWFPHPWWRHQMETFSALLALCAGNSPCTTRSFDVFFHLRLNNRLSKQPRGWWFEMPPWSLWRQCNALNYNNCRGLSDKQMGGGGGGGVLDPTGEGGIEATPYVPLFSYDFWFFKNKGHIFGITSIAAHTKMKTIQRNGIIVLLILIISSGYFNERRLSNTILLAAWHWDCVIKLQLICKL